jgi:hypothetical protein
VKIVQLNGSELYLKANGQRLFGSSVRPADIPEQQRMLCGQYLWSEGFRMVSGYITRASSQLSVGQMLQEFQDQRRTGPSAHHGPELTLVGPAYYRLEGKEWCPMGIGIWQPPRQGDK